MKEHELQEIRELLESFGKAQTEKIVKLEERIKQVEGIKPANITPINSGTKELAELKIEVIGASDLTLTQRQEFIMRLRELMKEWRVFSVNMTFVKQ